MMYLMLISRLNLFLSIYIYSNLKYFIFTIVPMNLPQAIATFNTSMDIKIVNPNA